MFQRNRHFQEAYTNVVKTYGNTLIIHIKYAHLMHIKCAHFICMIIVKRALLCVLTFV